MNKLTTLALLLFACGRGANGTQIGVENGLVCEVVSDVLVTDLSVVPDGFTTSAAALFEGHWGTHELMVSSQPDEAPLASGESIMLTLSHEGAEIRALIYEGHNSQDPSENGIPCGRKYVTDVSATVAHDSVDWEGTVELVFDEEGDVSGRLDGDAGFADPLPPPTQFAAADMDRLAPSVFLSGAKFNGDVIWTTYISWEGERDDGLGEDGGPSLHSELVLYGSTHPEL